MSLWVGLVEQLRIFTGESSQTAMCLCGWVWLSSRVSTWVGLVEQPCARCMATLFRNAREIDMGREDWTQYALCLAHFFTANQIIYQDSMKVLLLTMICPTAFMLL